MHLQTGWFPHDEGQLGQAAERVLVGEMPHRDFDDMYTGGQTYLNALSFKLFGVRSESIRWMLWGFFVPFIACVFWIANRVTTPLNAGLVTFFCGAITLPVNSPALPSWYNLFFMVYGMVCLMKFIETRHRHWLFLSGVIAGLSILIKVTGVYFVAAGILVLVNDEQLCKSPHRMRSIAYAAFVAVCLAIFAGCGLVFSTSQDWLMSTLHLTMPLVLLASFTAWREAQLSKGGFGFRIRRLLSTQIPFLLGVAFPVIGFVIFYLQAGAIESLYEGVFVLPQMRVSQAGHPFPALPWMMCSLPIVIVLLLGLFEKISIPRFIGPALVCSVALLVVSWSSQTGFKLTFQSLRNLAPFVALISIFMLAIWKTQRLTRVQQNYLFLAAAMLVMGSLIQFPYASDLYFFFVVPLLVLAVLFVIEFQCRPLRQAHFWLFGMFTLLVVMRMNSFSPVDNIRGFPSTERGQSVGLNRCSLVVDDYVARNYQLLVDEIQQRTSAGEYIYAGPDFPEAYFLSERKNPTRIFYDFFRPEFQKDLVEFSCLIDSRDVKLVVLKSDLEFSTLSPAFEEFIRKTFPNRKPVECIDCKGRPIDPQFVIYWRD